MRGLLIGSAIAVASIGLALAQTPQVKELKVKPGNWETSTVMEMTMNMNGRVMNIPGQTFKQTECMKPEDAAFSPDDLTQEGCTISDFKSTDRSMSFSMSCNQQGAMMTGKMAFELEASREAGSGTLSMQGELPGQAGSMSIQGTSTAKRIGDC